MCHCSDYISTMAKNITNWVATPVGGPIRGSMSSSVLPGARTELAVSWPRSRPSERDAGNPCIGIAVGCVLSLPIWIGLVALYVSFG